MGTGEKSDTEHQSPERPGLGVHSPGLGWRVPPSQNSVSGRVQEEVGVQASDSTQGQTKSRPQCLMRSPSTEWEARNPVVLRTPHPSLGTCCCWGVAGTSHRQLPPCGARWDTEHVGPRQCLTWFVTLSMTPLPAPAPSHTQPWMRRALPVSCCFPSVGIKNTAWGPCRTSGSGQLETRRPLHHVCQ